MRWQFWLPAPQEISDAVQLRRGVYSRGTMQQALGMIFLLGLLAGLLPFLVNWFTAARIGTALPLAQVARALANTPAVAPWPDMAPMGFNPQAWGEVAGTLAGLPTPFPGWLAAGVTALGVWVRWPLQWLSWWIVYGALVMVANKALGATVTLQRFYAATGFAAGPLLLTGLQPIPCLGPAASAVGFLWALAVYVYANADVTGFSLGRAALAAALPLVFLAALSLIGLGLVFFLTLFVALG